MGADPVIQLAAGVAALAGAVCVVLLFRRFPQVAVAAWGITLYLTPIWFGVQVGGLLTFATMVTGLAVLASSFRAFRWSWIDLLVIVFFLAVCVTYVTGDSNFGHIRDIALMWMLPYAWGRMILTRSSLTTVTKWIGILAVIVAALAIVEFVTDENIFFSAPGASSSIWSNQQYRGGLPRAEAAFGHSIALGGSLAMSAPFVLTTTWPLWVRLCAFGVVGAGTVVTISRIGLVGLVIAVVLTVAVLGAYLTRRIRFAILGVGVAVGAVAVPFVFDVLLDAGEEAAGSAAYRSDLMPLLYETVILGSSPSREILATGEDYFGGYRSIDSALILTTLRFGLLPAGILIVILAVACISVLRGRATPASVALVSQVPAFFTVALITQYAALVWFMGGLAVSAYHLRPKLEEPSWNTTDVPAPTRTKARRARLLARPSG